MGGGDLGLEAAGIGSGRLRKEQGAEMSCSPHDLRDYLLQELGGAERREVERHAASCGACRLELDRLRMTEAALASLRDEEIPRRIAFVSDKIFEPSLLHRWWRAGWAPAGVLIAAAIVFSAL